MAKVELTKELGEWLKETRIKQKLSGKDLATELEKSPAYISKLESADYKSLDYDVLLDILKVLFKEDEEEIEEQLEYLVRSFNFEFTENERTQQTNNLNFDTVTRLIPVPKDLIDWINNELTNAKISLESLVDLINQNNELRDLDDSKYEKNLWYFENGRSFIFIELNKNQVEEILNGKISKCNYVTIKSMVLNLMRLQGKSYRVAERESIKRMNEYKFYSLYERSKLLRDITTNEERDKLLSEIDKSNIQLVNNILKYFRALSTRDVEYANTKFKALLNNFEFDSAFTFAFLGIDLTKLKEVDRDTKTEFLKNVVSLVDEYGQKVNKEEDTELYKI